MGLEIMEDGGGRQKPTILVIDAGEMARKFVRDVLSHPGYWLADTIQQLYCCSRCNSQTAPALGVAMQMKEDDDLKSIPIIAVSASAVKAMRKNSEKADSAPIWPNRCRCVTS